jgi:hypothetical protein
MGWKVAVKVRTILTLAWAVLEVYCIRLDLDPSIYRLRCPGSCSLASRRISGTCYDTDTGCITPPTLLLLLLLLLLVLLLLLLLVLLLLLYINKEQGI